MRVLVTGASGFVGSRLIATLAAQGFEPVACGRRQPPVDVAFRRIDDLDEVDWPPLLSGIDAVVHCAGLAHTRASAAADYERINTQATLRLAEACAGSVGRFVFLSSIRAITGPTAAEPLDEGSPARPTDAYGRSKLAAEQGLARLDLSSVSLRPVVVYGPGVKGNLARILKLARTPAPLPLASLNAPRSFLALDNLIGAILFLLTRREPGASLYAVADPAPSSVAELVAALREGMGRTPRLFAAPPALLRATAHAAGQGDSFRTMAAPMIVSPARLLALGWTPTVASTPDGARAWGRAAQLVQE